MTVSAAFTGKKEDCFDLQRMEADYLRRNKYNAKKVTLDGLTFDSQKEARRWSELVLLEKAGEIRQLEVHPKYECVVNGKKICTYIADFRYFEGNRRVIEDVKSPATAKLPVFRLKKKLVEAIYKVPVTIV